MAFSPPDKGPQTNLNPELWEQGLPDGLSERTPPQFTAMVCPGPATALPTGSSAVPSFLLVVSFQALHAAFTAPQLPRPIHTPGSTPQGPQEAKCLPHQTPKPSPHLQVYEEIQPLPRIHTNV